MLISLFPTPFCHFHFHPTLGLEPALILTLRRKSAKSDDCCLNKLLYISIGLLNTTEKPSKDVLLDFCKTSQSGPPVQCKIVELWEWSGSSGEGRPQPVTDSKWQPLNLPPSTQYLPSSPRTFQLLLWSPAFSFYSLRWNKSFSCSFSWHCNIFLIISLLSRTGCG